MAKILLDEVGVAFTFKDRQSVTQLTAVQWDGIDKIVAYKRDIFAFDLICLAIVDKDRSFEVSEDMEGWGELIETLSARLPGMPASSAWWDKVAQPPFATNQTILFSRRA
jgi:hypothetical protein